MLLRSLYFRSLPRNNCCQLTICRRFLGNSISAGYPAEPKPDDKIVVAMSSGVDSSVTAALYASKYKNVQGIYMANWSQTAKCTEAEWNDVQKVCGQIGISCERVNFEKEYWNEVFLPMIDMYQRGLTPNPDVGCNREVKFGKLIEHLTLKLGTSKNWWLATGHYARISHSATESILSRGSNKAKDQSFYLSSIPYDALRRTLMPLGHYKKEEVRELARTFGLHTANKPDSQGLCFVSQEHSNFRDFLNEYIPTKVGNIITEDGKVWGKHQGIWHATIGQRLGTSMPQGDPRYSGVWFVSEKRVETNEIIIVRGRDNAKLFKRNAYVTGWRWLGNGEMKCHGDKLNVQYRSLQTPNKLSGFDFHGKDSLTLEFDEKQRALAPGQNIVLYNDDRVLGCGVLTGTF